MGCLIVGSQHISTNYIHILFECIFDREIKINPSRNPFKKIKSIMGAQMSDGRGQEEHGVNQIK